MQGNKDMEKTIKRDTTHASIVKDTSSITGVSERQVRRVILGECVNEEVMGVYMRLYEGRTELIAQLKQLVPFTD